MPSSEESEAPKILEITVAIGGQDHLIRKTMTSNDQKVLNIAHAVRDWCEREVTRLTGYDFSGDPSLSCMCAYASTVLMACLNHFGIQNVFFCCGTQHAFLRVNRKILDITATQFVTVDGQLSHRVEFAHAQSIRAKYKFPVHWTTLNKYQNLDDVFDALHPDSKTGFPKEQYWVSRKGMKSSARSAIAFCMKRGISVERDEARKLAA